MRTLAAIAVAVSLVAAAAPSSAGVWPTEIDRLARELESADVAERRAAAARLASLPAHLAKPLLLRALTDDDLDVRVSAGAAAAAHGVGEAEPVVLTWLGDRDARLRLAAAEVLRPEPSARAAAALSRVLGDGDARVRKAAADALGNAPTGDAALALLGHLDDPTADVRRAVVEALTRLGDARAVVPLVGKVQDAAPEVRRAVARALGELGDRRATPALVLALRDAVPDVRAEALAALGALGDPAAVLAIAPLSDPSAPADARRPALAALGRIGGEKATSILVAALERDESGPGKAPARDALASMRERAVPALLAVLEAPPSDRSAASAAEALGQIGASGAREPILRALRRGVLPATNALRALAALGLAESLPVVLELLSDRSPAVRAEARRAAEVLLDRGGVHGYAVDPIAAALADVTAPVADRAALVRLLGKTRAPRASQSLAPLVASKQAALRLAAIDALGALGDPGQDAALLAALDDDAPVVRARAGAALARAAGEASARALVERAASAEQQDRVALATALAGALGRARAPETFARVEAVLPSVDPAVRDALLEGVGRADVEPARALLGRVARSRSPADRRKAAEALGGHAAGAPALRSLLADPNASVRANAAWALASAGDASDLPALEAKLTESATAVAANAAIALGRLATSAGTPAAARGSLCAALADGRSYVRAGALAGLRLAGVRCDDGAAERRLLVRDPSPFTRAAAAELLLGAPAAGDGDRRALSRCRMEDPYGFVAARCATLRAPTDGVDAVTVLVVPAGRSRPAPEEPFALALADGTVRHGTADRRGAVFEARAPRGLVRLEVAAPFAR